MSEVVKANVPQTVLLQQLAEIGGNASGVEDIAHGIHKNIAVILFAVAISAYAPILLSFRRRRQNSLAPLFLLSPKTPKGFSGTPYGVILAYFHSFKMLPVCSEFPLAEAVEAPLSGRSASETGGNPAP